MNDGLKFRGIASATLDAKGRMALPARHRETMMAACDGLVTVTTSLHDTCLMLYPRTAWESVQEALEALPNIRSEVRWVQHVLIGSATDLALDGSGRLLLPAELRRDAELEKRLSLVGLGNKIEIWREDIWERHKQEGWKGNGKLPAEVAEIEELKRLSL